MKLNIRLKSGKEFNFRCTNYKLTTHTLTGEVVDFKYDGGSGECPVYLNPKDIESISVFKFEGEEPDGST